MELDKKVQINLTKQISHYHKELTKHPGHDNILPLLFRGSTNTTFLTDVYEEQISSGMELSKIIKLYIKFNYSNNIKL